MHLAGDEFAMGVNVPPGVHGGKRRRKPSKYPHRVLLPVKQKKQAVAIATACFCISYLMTPLTGIERTHRCLRPLNIQIHDLRSQAHWRVRSSAWLMQHTAVPGLPGVIHEMRA